MRRTFVSFRHDEFETAVMKENAELKDKWAPVFQKGHTTPPDLEALFDAVGLPKRGRIKFLAERTGFDSSSISRMLSGSREQKVSLRFLKSLRTILLEVLAEELEANHTDVITETSAASIKSEILETDSQPSWIFRQYGGIKAEIWKIVADLTEEKSIELLMYLRQQQNHQITELTGNKSHPSSKS